MTELKTFDEVMQKVHSQGCNCKQEIKKWVIGIIKDLKINGEKHESCEWIKRFNIKDDELQ